MPFKFPDSKIMFVDNEEELRSPVLNDRGIMELGFCPTTFSKYIGSSRIKVMITIMFIEIWELRAKFLT